MLYRKPRLQMFVVLSLAAVCAVVSSGCSKQQAGGGFEMPPTPVEIADVQAITVFDKFEAVGTIEAGEAITVVPEIDAIVTSLPFSEGQSVDSGDLIAVLDDAAIAAAYASASAIREQAKITYDRTRSMSDAGATSKQELDIASAALKVAEANTELARVRLSKTKIRAPFAGATGARMVSPGAYLRAGTVITTLAQLNRLKVTFSAPERVFPLLQRGSEVTVATTAYPDLALTGKIDVVDPMVDSLTRSVRVIARIANPDRKFRPGMSASVTAVLGERPNSLTIPDEAVFGEGNQAFVFSIQPDNSVLRTPVVLGSRQAGSVEIVSGLTAGAKVVRAGHQKLYDGAKVMPAGAMPPGGGNPAQGSDSALKPADSGSNK